MHAFAAGPQQSRARQHPAGPLHFGCYPGLRRLHGIARTALCAVLFMYVCMYVCMYQVRMHVCRSALHASHTRTRQHIHTHIHTYIRTCILAMQESAVTARQRFAALKCVQLLTRKPGRCPCVFESLRAFHISLGCREDAVAWDPEKRVAARHSSSCEGILLHKQATRSQVSMHASILSTRQQFRI